MMTLIIGAFLIVHGFAHLGLAAAPIPNDSDSKPGDFFTAPTRSWFFYRLSLQGSATKWIGPILVGLIAVGFLAAGLGLIGVTGLNSVWPAVALVSASLSLLLLLLFWHAWLVVGLIIDLGILAVLLLPGSPVAL